MSNSSHTTMPPTLQPLQFPLPPIKIHSHALCSADVALHTAFFDSALPYLAARGSVAQWGIIPMAERPGFEKKVEEWDKRCIEARERGGQWAMIAEREIDRDVDLRKAEWRELKYRVDNDSGRRCLIIAAAVVREGWFPEYVEEILGMHVREAREKGGWAYLEILLSDFRAGQWRTGGGAALLEGIREEASERGLVGMYVDCWAGNKGGLIKFYEDQGFELLGTFSAKKRETNPWDGALLRIDLTSKL